MKKSVYIILASVCVVCGTIGIFLPVLPTTPFLLLAGYFYMNSSPGRFYWLVRNPYLGPYIRDYYSKRGMPLRQKAKTITMLWFTLILSIIFIASSLWLKLILMSVGVGVTIHIAMKKTRPDNY
ncbi:MAG: YbaN family protein [Bacteroidales bacterium]|nr:YbaN family protein [Bacteroidales bacterium]